MIAPRSYHRFAVLFLAILSFLSPSLHAQGPEDIGVKQSDGVTAMKAGEWEKALQMFEEVINQHDGNAKQLFGSKFGWFWYHKGYCELKLKKFGEAMSSFEACYVKYPNDLKAQGKQGTKGDEQSINNYHIRSILKWGEAAQGAEDYDLAVKKFLQFLEERKVDPARNKYQRGAFYINLGICYLKSGKTAEGLESLGTAIDNKKVFPTPDAGILAGFRALVESSIARSDDQAFFDFLSKYRADVTLEPFQLYEYTPIFMKLAAQALEAGLPSVAFELYALVPSTVAVLEDTKSRLSLLGGVERPFPDGNKRIDKNKIEATQALARKQSRGGTPPEVTGLAATAFIHETNGNPRGAYASYFQLEKFYPKSSKREDYLFNLVRTSSMIGEIFETEKFGQRFLDAFPGSEHEAAVRSMMLTSLFYSGEYQDSIKVALSMEGKLPTPSEQHDIWLHVLGGSYYYTGKYDLAQELIDQHVKEYPESKFKIASRYFEGSNLSRLQEWSKAGKKLDAFLKDFPDAGKNVYLPFALYDRASVHYAESEMPPALEMVNRLESEFSDAAVIDMAYNLKGNVLESEDELDEAEQYYLKAYEIAKRRGNTVVVGESLYYLVNLLGQVKRGGEDNPRIADAIPYYDEFWGEYGDDSPFKSQVAVAGIAAMTKAGRTEEALERLQGVIAELAQQDGSFGLEEAINSYTDAYLVERTPEELKDHYYNFPGIDADDRAARALLRIAIIGVFEGVLEDSVTEKDEDAARRATAMIKVLFSDMKETFKPAELSNYILISLGDYLREKTTAPRESLPYYEEIVSNEDPTHEFKAQFGIADVYGNSDVPAENDKAIKSLEDVLAKADDNEVKERALYRIVTILAKKADWQGVEERAKEYLKTKGFKKYAPWASMLLAKSFDERGMAEDALFAYNSVWGAYTGYIEVSAPATKRILELTWNRDNPAAPPSNKSDRQIAYEFGWNYLDSTKHIRSGNEIKDQEKAAWDEVQEIVSEYEANPTVKDMETIKKELEEKSSR